MREVVQLVCAVTHGGDHNDDFIARFNAPRDAPGHMPDAVRVRDRSTAVFVDYKH